MLDQLGSAAVLYNARGAFRNVIERGDYDRAASMLSFMDVASTGVRIFFTGLGALMAIAIILVADVIFDYAAAVILVLMMTLIGWGATFVLCVITGVPSKHADRKRLLLELQTRKRVK